MTYVRLFFIFLFTGIMSLIALIGTIDRTFTFYFWLSRVFARGVLLISAVKLEIKNADKLDKNAVFVYVSNHSSAFDIPALMAAVPNRASIVFKKELTRIPLFGWQLALGPFIVIDRQNPEKAMGSIQRARRTMEEKAISIVLFAEGTRSKTEEVQPFKRGAFYLASRVHFPIVPVSVAGTGKIMPKGKLRLKRGTITVTFDAPITINGDLNKKEELELMEKVREIVIANKEKS